MSRIARRAIPVVFLAGAVAVAAPVPKDFDTAARKLERLFGKTVQPAKAVGEFKFDATSLTVKMPVTRFGHEEAPPSGMHTQVPAVGDFVAEVVMSVASDRIPLAMNKSIALGGGLFAQEPGKKNAAHASVAQVLNGRSQRGNQPGGWKREVISFVDGDDDYLDEEPVVDPTAPLHFRLTRSGNMFAPAVSTDGKDWRSLKPRKLALPREVSVGVFCFNRTGEEAEVRFESFTITPTK